MAACELSCMTSQGIKGRRIGELIALQHEIGAGAEQTNQNQRGVDWQCKIDNARHTLKKLYPKMKTG